MTFGIIGGGIGGLSLGLAMHRQDLPFQIFEQAEQLAPVGAGILLGNNVMQIYERLGIRKRLEEVANPIHHLQITRPDLRPLSKVDLSPFVKRYGVQNLAIHRAALQKVLVDSLPSGTVELGKQMKDLDYSDSELQIAFSDGSRREFGALVGADGIYSRVRESVFPEGHIRSAHQLCWRGVAEVALPENDLPLVREAWGPGIRFGIVPLDAKRVYWFAVQSDGMPLEKTELVELFAEFHPLVGQLIEATPQGTIHTAPLEDLRLNTPWYRGSVCLIGDAAHAMTPNMGQGAGQAIEDAYLLAAALAKNDQASEAFSAYYAARKKKVKRIVATSWQIGQMAHWRSKLPLAIRAGLLRSTPDSLNRRQLASVFKLDEL